MLLRKRDAAGGHTGFFFHRQFAFLVTAPHRFDESAMLFLKLFCLFYALCREDMLFQIHFCRVIEPLLDGIQQLGDAGIQFVE